MLIFLYGSDGYRLKENVDTIVGAYQKKHKSGVSYYHFNLDESGSFDELSNAVKSVSFFDETKLIIVKNAFYYTGLTGINGLGGLIKDFKISEDKKTVLVFIENKSESNLWKTSKDLFTLFSGKNNLVRNFEYLSGAKLSNWVKNKFKENGHNVSSAAADLLVGIVGNESWALANEINKLSNYLTGKTCHDRSCLLTQEDIGLLVNRKEESNIFDLVDAVGSQNKAKAFEMTYRLINAGHDGYYLLNMLIYHFENLLAVSDLLEKNKLFSPALIAKQCGLHPFVAKKALSQARKFQKGDLVAKFNHLAGLDVASKSGLVNLEDSLYNFVVS